MWRLPHHISFSWKLKCFCRRLQAKQIKRRFSQDLQRVWGKIKSAKQLQKEKVPKHNMLRYSHYFFSKYKETEKKYLACPPFAFLAVQLTPMSRNSRGFVYAASTNSHKLVQTYMHISPGASAL